MILRVIALVWEHFYYYRARGEEGEEGEEGKREEGGRERGGKREGGEEGSFGKEKLERRNFFFWVDICVSWDIIALGKS